MKRQLTVAFAACLILAGAGAASAQPRHDRGNDRHDGAAQNNWRPEWRRGGRIDRTYWGHASRVDWRTRHLRRPPRGYEWREVNGNYVLAAVATGLIADLVMNSR